MVQPITAAWSQDTSERQSMDGKAAFEIRHHNSISEITERDWNSLFVGQSEDWAYFLACEKANSKHFRFSALAAYSGQKLIAAAPVFKLDFRIDTALGERAQKLSSYVMSIAPQLVKLPILGMGHPMTEECPIGFASDLSDAKKSILLTLMVTHLEAVASNEGIKIVVLKDVTNSDCTQYRASLQRAGFGVIESLPIAQMDARFSSIEHYIQSLPSKRRTQLRKKMRQAGEVDVSFVENIDGIEAEIKALYEETRQRRARDYEAFDEVPEDYFSQVTAASHGNVKVMLSRIDGRLVGFMFLLVEANRLIFKFVGMQYPLALERSLYFHQWMSLVEYCIKNGITTLHAGQTNYITKVRMGCELRRSWIFYKYTGLILGPVIRAIDPKLSLAAQEPDLIELGEHARYMQQS
jgi:predicted N-acyltransferase